MTLLPHDGLNEPVVLTHHAMIARPLGAKRELPPAKGGSFSPPGDLTRTVPLIWSVRNLRTSTLTAIAPA